MIGPTPPPPQDAERGITFSQDKEVMKEVGTEMEEEDDNVVLLSVSSDKQEKSVAKRPERPEPLEIDDNAFKQRPRKSVLKSPSTPTTVYTSSSPPLSPTSNDSSRSAQRKNSMNCCLIM